MNKEEIKKKFEENVEYLRKNIPPDDIYMFTEQTFMACLYFLKQWSKHADINAICQDDLIARKYVVNIMGLLKCRELNIDLTLDLDLDSVEGDDENNH